ncbi:MAG: UDP-3-O-acyl-N-acetylglucosamine deacetylase [Silvanigrellaceae bacterium]|nr:UDP-3-O-acyl-N-acetylglucosamine deacetylase [Silvanigrellaceae bacterium]
MRLFQRTTKRTIQFNGIALHSGRTVQVEIRPSHANSGISFQRTDLPGKPYIKATPENVLDTVLATKIGTPEAFVSTIEHLMAAFYGFGIDNAVVAINHSEMPILDGSSAPFLALLDEAGVRNLDVERKYISILKPIEIFDKRDPTKFIRIEPSKEPLLTYVIDFLENSNVIGKQQVTIQLSGHAFCEQLAFARTFCLREEVEYMQSRGLAKGGSLENAIVISREDGVLNKQGLRNPKEFVLHKALDCIGDLSLINMPVLGHVIAHKAGHELHTQLAMEILAQESARTILSPSHKGEFAFLKELFSFPSSLAEIKENLHNLAIG